MRTVSLLLSSLCTLAACGDNDEFIPPGDDDVAPDANGNPDGPDLTVGVAVAVAGDFAGTGIVSTVDGNDLDVTQGAIAGVASGDPVIRAIGDELFVINRFGGDNVTILDAESLALIDQFSTGEDTNPQDVAVVGDKLYIAALGAGSILVVDRGNDTAITEISLATLDDDGLPDCVSVHAVGTRVYAACGLLDGFAAVENGVIAIIDTTDDTVEDTIDMPAMNPVGWFEQAPGGAGFGDDLLISTSSFIDSSLGCLVRVSTGETPAATCGPTNVELGGGVSRIAVHFGRIWAAVVAYDNFATLSGRLVELDPETGDPEPASSPSAQTVMDVAGCNAFLFVTDKADGAQGVRVYSSGGDEVTTEALDVGLPPTFQNGLACQQLPL